MLQPELIPARNEGAKDLLVVLHGLGDSMEGYRWGAAGAGGTPA